MIHINLLPPEFAEQQSKQEKVVVFGTAGVLVFVVLFFFWFAKRSQSKTLDENIAKAESDLQKYQAIVSQIDRIKQDTQRLTAKRDVITDLNRKRLTYPVFFFDLLYITPGDVWVKSIDTTEQGGNQLRVTMNSNASSNFALATWLSNLQGSPHFSAVDLGPISYATSPEGGMVLSFSLTCVYGHKGEIEMQKVKIEG
jgi:type IV pilus assembly protein PilN